MRRRVLQATIAAVAVAVILLGVPLALLGAQWVRQSDLRSLDTRAGRAASAIDLRLQLGSELTDRSIEAYVGSNGEIPATVVVRTPDDQVLRAGPNPTGRLVSVEKTGTSGTQVILYASYWGLFWRSARIVMLVVGAALVAFGAGIAMAIWQANRLARPLVYLAASAEQLGTGQVRPALEPSGVEEIDLVAAELSRSADRMAGRLAAERQFASDASHQLRTPLTALTMRLEEIAAVASEEEVREEARISLEQVERLVRVVDDLLAASRRAQGGTTEAVSLADVVHQQQEEWVPTFARAGRKLVVDVDPSVQVLATPGPLAQVQAPLIENSHNHLSLINIRRCRPSHN